jgi:hypothetical protein
MKNEYEFPQIDASYWRIDDKTWVAERKANWEKIEKYYSGGLTKSKKGINIVKRYYLKGEMPDFKALRDWDDVERHLDLYSFIWLHPSKNKNVLSPLRDSYVNSPLIMEQDVQFGLGVLFLSGSLWPAMDYTGEDVAGIFYTDGFNKDIFEIIMGDYECPYFPEKNDLKWKIPKFHKYGYYHIINMAKWTCAKTLSILSNDCLYQYDIYLNFWTRGCEADNSYFSTDVYQLDKPYLIKALHRINRFDVDKEGDTARGRFVHKIRKLLDEHQFHPTLKKLWAAVKQDTSDVKGLWRL